jgi:hypothetical protein
MATTTTSPQSATSARSARSARSGRATRLRRAALSLATGAVAAGSLATLGAGAATAAPVQPHGFSAVEQCTGLTGAISYSPGLLAHTARNQSSVLTGTLSGCSGFNGAQAGTGTITIVAHGSSLVSNIAETGTVTVNWPASSGLNPSNGTVTLTRPSKDLPIAVRGSFTSGAFTGAALATDLLVTSHHGSGTKAHPITRQTLVNTTPLTAKVNLG